MSKQSRSQDSGFMSPTTSNRKSFPLRLPRTMRKQAGEMARHEGVSLNQFIAQAIAEKIARMELSLPVREGDAAK